MSWVPKDGLYKLTCEKKNLKLPKRSTKKELLEKFSKKELQQMCKEHGSRGYQSCVKADLITFMLDPTKNRLATPDVKQSENAKKLKEEIKQTETNIKTKEKEIKTKEREIKKQQTEVTNLKKKLETLKKRLEAAEKKNSKSTWNKEKETKQRR